MSAPPPGRPRRLPPLQERTNSQNNSHAIRLVPYSPPRLSDRTASQSSSQSQQPQASESSVGGTSGAGGLVGGDGPGSGVDSSGTGGSGNDPDQKSNASSSTQSKKSAPTGVDFSKGYAGGQGSALSSARSSAVLLAGAKDEVVSGAKPATLPSRSPQATAPAAPAIRSPTYPPFITRANSRGVNAPSPPPRELYQQSRPTPAAAAGPSSASAPPRLRFPPRQGNNPQDVDAVAADTTVPTGGPSAPVRPRSRRRNFVALHSDKTFSIVPHQAHRLRVAGSTTDGAGTGIGNESGSGSGSHGRASELGSSLSSSMGRSSVTSPPLSMSTFWSTSSHERLSDAFFSDAFSDDRPISPYSDAGTIPDRVHKPATPSPGSSTSQLIAEDPIMPDSTASSSSPWNYRMIGGLRKVPKTPDLKQKKIAQPVEAPDRETVLPPLFEAAATTSSPIRVAETAPPAQVAAGVSEVEAAAEALRSRSLLPKESFISAQTVSTTSETTNYKVYSHSSPAQLSSDSLPPPSSSGSNVEILSRSSPAVSPFESSRLQPPGTSDSDENFILHGDPSPASSIIRQPGPKFSQESLIVPPLRPARKKSYEKFGYYKSRSRESLRRVNSAKSIKSISSIIASQAAEPLFVAPAFFNPSNSYYYSFPTETTVGPSRSIQQQRQRQDSWAGSTAPATSSGRGSLPQSQRVPMIEAHPHQWSSQLSTVMSESEESEQGGGPAGSGSRSDSRATGASGSGGNRRSSSGWASSTHSRQMLSISSSLAAQLDEQRSQSRSQSHSHSQSNSNSYSNSYSHSHSTSDSLERPRPTRSRGILPGGTIWTVRDQDEDGDGLADLHSLSPKPSRTGLSGFFHSSNTADSSSRNIHSSSSSRAGSFTAASLPAWARLYYGSGERRHLSAMSVSDISEGSRPSSPLRTGGTVSPVSGHFPMSIYSPRRRAREAAQAEAGPSGSRPFSGEGSMDITVIRRPTADTYSRPHPGLRKKPSSIWSPHLRIDRRASRYSVWDPPSVSWSAESGILGRRNVQVVLFTVGFIFPFAWMIAALLPLPADPGLEMPTRDNSRSELGMPAALRMHVECADDVRYQSARWWRNLNRLMSIVGLLIIGAIIGLIVVSVRQGWNQRG